MACFALDHLPNLFNHGPLPLPASLHGIRGWNKTDANEKREMYRGMDHPDWRSPRDPEVSADLVSSVACMRGGKTAAPPEQKSNNANCMPPVGQYASLPMRAALSAYPILLVAILPLILRLHRDKRQSSKLSSSYLPLCQKRGDFQIGDGRLPS